MRGKSSRADGTISAISAECAIITTTLKQLGRIVKDDATSVSDRLRPDDAVGLQRDLNQAFECCDVTLVALSNTLQKCSSKGIGGSLSWKSKAKFMFNDSELRDRLRLYGQ